MIRINDGWFMPSIMKDGRSFEMRDDHDNLLASGRRAPH